MWRHHSVEALDGWYFPTLASWPDSYIYGGEDQPEVVSNKIATFAHEVCGLSGAEIHMLQMNFAGAMYLEKCRT